MNLESLANELLLDLFEFLNYIHLLRAFQYLNARFHTLLCKHFQTHRLDFRSVSKSDFDFVCGQYFSSILDGICSLHLSDDDDTPGQIDCFYSHHLALSQCTHLKSLSLYHIRSKQTMNKMMNELPFLFQLTHLNFNKCYFPHEEIHFSCIINRIWTLPSLTDCRLGIIFHERANNFPSPKIISSSLKHLSFEDLHCDLNRLSHIFQHTPHLQSLQSLFIDNLEDRHLTSPVLSIIKLNLFVRISLHPMICLLQNMLNLCHLTIEAEHIEIDGHQWEQIITKYLPKLKVFQLRMQIGRGYDEKEVTVNQLLESFRSEFWLEEHQWYVRCHWNPDIQYNYIHLYTLPYAFTNFDICVGYRSKSTCPYDDDYWLIDRVRTLYYHSSSFSFEDSSMHRIRFPNIRHLAVAIPFDDHFLTIVPKFDQLNSLNVALHDNSQSQLQTLLDRVSCLYYLSIDLWPSPEMFEINFTSISIYQLDLRAYESVPYGTWFDSEQCAILSHSPLGKQCEVLKIRVENRKNILELVNTMTKLRALNVESLDDACDCDSSSADDELFKWLKDSLPSTCIITRDVNLCIRVWIR